MASSQLRDSSDPLRDRPEPASAGAVLPSAGAGGEAGDVAPSRWPRFANLMVHAERVLFAGGIALFGILVYRLGPIAVWDNLRHIGWGFLLVLGQEGLAYAANTAGWRFAFAPPRPAIGFKQLFAARLAGEAINNLTPTATIGGEVVRGRMLEGVVEPSAAWASIAVAKLVQTFAQMTFVFLGLLLVVPRTILPEGFARGLLIGLALITGGMLTGMALQRHGMFGAGARLAGRFGVRIPEGTMERLAQLDAEIARFYAAPGAFVMSAIGFFAGWCIGAIEVYIVLYCLDLGPSLERALTIEVLSVAFDALLFFVPAKAGTQEGGKVLIFDLLGLDPAKGLTLGIVRRLRELSWSMAGLVILARHHARQRAASSGGAPS